MNDMSRPVPAVIFEDHRIPSGTPSIDLYIRNKRPAVVPGRADKTIVMVHGATFSSGSLYDVPMNGSSFMDYLAGAGFDVFAVDVRGYGRSTRPPEMEVEGHRNPPLVNTETGVADLTTAVDFVLRHRGIDAVNIFGMSWGGTVAGTFATREHRKTLKAALVAPQWLSEKAIPLDPGGPLDAYRLVPVADMKGRWLNAVPESHRGTLIPEGWFEKWAQATADEDPWSAEKAPGRLRATNGPIQDIRDYWAAGRPLYDPSSIVAPVLLVHGEWDHDVPIDLAFNYFRQLTGARYRRWLEVGEATHMVLLEKNRMMAFKAVSDFFSEAYAPES